MKIRTGYVSNSSSSSFIIKCKCKEKAEEVQSAFWKLLDYWREIYPQINDCYINENNYEICSAQEVVNYFSDSVENIFLNQLEQELKNQEEDGTVFIVGTASDEGGDIEGDIVRMFNEFVLYRLSTNWQDPEVALIKSWRWS